MATFRCMISLEREIAYQETFEERGILPPSMPKYTETRIQGPFVLPVCDATMKMCLDWALAEAEYDIQCIAEEHPQYTNSLGARP